MAGLIQSRSYIRIWGEILHYFNVCADLLILCSTLPHIGTSRRYVCIMTNGVIRSQSCFPCHFDKFQAIFSFFPQLAPARNDRLIDLFLQIKDQITHQSHFKKINSDYFFTAFLNTCCKSVQ